MTGKKGPMDSPNIFYGECQTYTIEVIIQTEPLNGVEDNYQSVAKLIARVITRDECSAKRETCIQVMA